MDAFIHTLLTMTLAASVAAAVVMILRLLFKNLPRRIVCLLWLVVALRMVCPVGMFHLPVSLMPQAVSQGTEVQRVLPQTAPTAATPESPALTNPITPTTQPVPTPETQAPASHVPQVSTILFTVWAVGAGGMAFWAVLSYLRLKQRTDEAILVAGNVYESDLIDSPFVCGLVKPKIYLPLGLEEPHRRYVLLHENVHIRRRDYLTKPLAYVLLCLHWFNPVLWLAYRLFCRDVETACDQAVTRDFAREDVAGYAAALLHLGRKQALPAAVPLAFGEENPKNRIKAVLNYRTPQFWVIVVAVAAVVIVSVLLLGDTRTRSHYEWDGVPVEQVFLVDRGLPVPLPAELQAQLMDILKEYPQGDLTRVDTPDLGTQKYVQLTTGPQDGTTFCLSPTGQVVRENAYTYEGDRAYTTVLDGLAKDPAYVSWRAAASDYVNNQWINDICALRHTSLKDHKKVETILDTIGLRNVIGDFTVSYARNDKGLTIRPEQDFLPTAVGAWRGGSMDELLVYLIDDLSYVGWQDGESLTQWVLTQEDLNRSPSPNLVGADNMSIDGMPIDRDGTDRFATAPDTEIMNCILSWQDAARTYLSQLVRACLPQDISVVYLAPGLNKIPADSVATLTPALFSAPLPGTDQVRTVKAPRYVTPDSNLTPIFAPEVAQMNDMAPSPIQIQDGEGKETGFWLYYILDSDTGTAAWYLAYAAPTGSLIGDPLTALFYLMPEYVDPDLTASDGPNMDVIRE